MKRKRFSKALKAKVVVEAIKGQKPVNQLAAEFGPHLTQVKYLEQAGHGCTAEIVRQ